MAAPSNSKYFVYLAIERKEAILDPSGKATEHALGSLGFDSIEQCRIGKLVRLAVSASSSEEASSIASDAAAKLLSNPIMESFTVIDVRTEPSLEPSSQTASV